MVICKGCVYEVGVQGVMVRSFRSKPVGWQRDSYRHYLAAKYGSSGHKYFMGAFSRLPQYQLAEIKRVRGEKVALEAREMAIAENLSAKELADRFNVEYVRGKGLAHQVAVERMIEGPRDVGGEADWSVARKKHLEVEGKRTYERAREELERVSEEIGKNIEHETDLLASPGKVGSYFDYDQARRDIRAQEAVLNLKRLQIAELDRKVEEGGYAALLPSDYALPKDFKLVPAGQSILAEFGGPIPEGEYQKRVTEYMAKKRFQPIKYRNPEKGDHDIAKVGIDSKGRRVRVYEKEHHVAASKEKFSRVRGLKKEYPKILEHISKDVDAKDETTRENARVAYIIAKTGFRPGTRKDTQGDVKAYGVTTLKKSHVAVSDGDVRFKFVGKKGVPISLKVHDEKMSKIIQQQKKESGKELFPNTSDATVRNYLYQYGRFKPKDFRTLKATQIAEPLVKRGIAESVVVSKVAKQLHNTPGVSKSSYVDPKLWGRKQ